NGCGFDPKSVRHENKSRFSGIGVNNVDQRIKLHYGPQYGLKIDSQPGKGTVCRVTIPRKLYKEEFPE
ncbi:MAG: sensor histidine kinase, partial [Lachnospiraceae bacterium]